MEFTRLRKKRRCEDDAAALHVEYPADVMELLQGKDEGHPGANKIYRETTLGEALGKSLETMVGGEKIPESLAAKILGMFDSCMTHAMTRRATGNVQFKAQKLNKYKFMQGVWTLVLDNVEFRNRNCLGNFTKVKIVANGGAKNAVTL